MNTLGKLSHRKIPLGKILFFLTITTEVGNHVSKGDKDDSSNQTLQTVILINTGKTKTNYTKQNKKQSILLKIHLDLKIKSSLANSCRVLIPSHEEGKELLEWPCLTVSPSVSV